MPQLATDPAKTSLGSQWRHGVVIILSLAVVLGLAYRLEHIINPLLVSLIIAYILDPFVALIEKRGIPRLAVVIGVYVLGAIIAVLILVLLVPVLVNQVDDFVRWISKKSVEGKTLLQKRDPERYTNLILQLQKTGATYASQVLQQAFNYTTSFLLSTFTVINLLILIPLYTFFFLWRFDHIVQVIKRYLPRKHKEKIIATFAEINPLVANFFRGRLIICGLVGVASAIGLSFVGVPFAWPLGLAVGLLNLVPFLAPIIGLPVVMLITYLTFKDWSHPLASLIVCGAIQAADGFVLTPLIQGKMVGLHPITTIVVIFIGSDLAGIFGLILAIPATAAVKVIFKQFIWPEIAEATNISLNSPAPPPPHPQKKK
jgi:predicted PurR-regulated permease PerM